MTLPAGHLNAPNVAHTSSYRSSIRHVLGYVTLQEVSGALGDLGSFLPVVVALVPAAQLDLGTTLVLTGAYNIASGLAFGIPMCVQPMSTIAAIALTPPGLSLVEIVSAGAFVSACVLLLGVTRVMDLVTRVTPAALVAAIQLAVGLKLAQQGIRQVVMHTGSRAESHNPTVWRPFGGIEGWGLGVAVVLYLLLVTLPQESQQQMDHSHQTRQAGHQEQQQGSHNHHHHQQQQQQQEEEDEELHRQAHGYVQHRASAGLDVEQQQQQQQQQQPLLATHLEPVGSSGASSDGCHHRPQELQLHLSQQKDDEQLASLPLAARASRADDRDHTGDPVVEQSACLPQGTCSSAQSPAALLVVVLGLVLTCVSDPGVLSELQLGPSRPHLILPSRQQFLEGVRKAGLAQLPTTALNSVVAVSALAQQLYPHATPSQAAAWQPSAVATSVGVMNLLGVWWGAMPCCHGAGGLAAQHKFGARSGAAPVMLGAAKLVLGLCFGSSLFQLLQHFPGPLLGSLLLVAGLQLARSVHRLSLDSQGFGEMLVTAAVMLGVGDVALGFACGVVLHVALLVQQWLAKRRLW